MTFSSFLFSSFAVKSEKQFHRLAYFMRHFQLFSYVNCEMRNDEKYQEKGRAQLKHEIQTISINFFDCAY